MQFYSENQEKEGSLESSNRARTIESDPKAVNVAKHRKKPSVIKEKLKKQQKLQDKFSVGDSVYISTLGTTGIVYQPTDSKGEDLYPEDYDLDIVFESKEYRKKKHQLERKFDPSITIEHQK